MSRNHNAFGITALFDALRRQKHGLSLGAFRIKPNRLSLTEIEVLSIRGHVNVAARYASLGQDKPCRILIVDSGRWNKVYMDVESLAFLLDTTIASDTSHFLRRLQARKDSDD